jgi:hypothetical protein
MSVVATQPLSSHAEVSITERATRELEQSCPYAWCFRDVDYELDAGVLRLEGSVSSFYLKQLLQTFLKELDGVERIDNRVDVVNSQGLSSVRPH